MTTLNRQNLAESPALAMKKTVFAIFVLLQTVFFLFPPHLQAAVRPNNPAPVSISWQQVAIPNTWRQASLKIANKLVY